MLCVNVTRRIYYHFTRKLRFIGLAPAPNSALAIIRNGQRRLDNEKKRVYFLFSKQCSHRTHFAAQHCCNQYRSPYDDAWMIETIQSNGKSRDTNPCTLWPISQTLQTIRPLIKSQKCYFLFDFLWNHILKKLSSAAILFLDQDREVGQKSE